MGHRNIESDWRIYCQSTSIIYPAGWVPGLVNRRGHKSGPSRGGGGGGLLMALGLYNRGSLRRARCVSQTILMMHSISNISVIII